MVFGTRENHEGRFLLENGLDGYIFWVLVVMGGLDLAACDASPTSVTGRLEGRREDVRDRERDEEQ